MKKIGIFILIAISLAGLKAQEVSKQIASLENDFKAFRYQRVVQKGRFLLTDPYTTRQDSLTIYQYMLSAAYAQNDSVTAGEIIHELLDAQPDFRLNTRNVSPKIVEFFNHIKKEHIVQTPIQSADSVNTQLSLPYPKKTPFPQLLAGIVFPGMSHVFANQKPKGYYFTAVSAGLGGGILYFWFATAEARDDYLNAAPGSNFNALYNSYNRNYQIRNGMAIAYVLWSAYCLYDFQTTPNIKPYFNPLNNTSGVQLNINW